MQADSRNCDRGGCGNLATCPYDDEHIATVGSTNVAAAQAEDGQRNQDHGL